MFASQISGKLVDELLAVFGSVLAALFVFDNATANFPVRRCQNPIDLASGRPPSSVQQV